MRYIELNQFLDMYQTGCLKDKLEQKLVLELCKTVQDTSLTINDFVLKKITTNKTIHQILSGGTYTDYMRGFVPL